MITSRDKELQCFGERVFKRRGDTLHLVAFEDKQDFVVWFKMNWTTPFLDLMANYAEISGTDVRFLYFTLDQEANFPLTPNATPETLRCRDFQRIYVHTPWTEILPARKWTYCTRKEEEAGNENVDKTPRRHRIFTSKYRGVAYVKSDKRWRATAAYKGSRVYVGRFRTEDEAWHQLCRKRAELGMPALPDPVTTAFRDSSMSNGKNIVRRGVVEAVKRHFPKHKLKAWARNPAQLVAGLLSASHSELNFTWNEVKAALRELHLSAACPDCGKIIGNAGSQSMHRGSRECKKSIARSLPVTIAFKEFEAANQRGEWQIPQAAIPILDELVGIRRGQDGVWLLQAFLSKEQEKGWIHAHGPRIPITGLWDSQTRQGLRELFEAEMIRHLQGPDLYHPLTKHSERLVHRLFSICIPSKNTSFCEENLFPGRIVVEESPGSPPEIYINQTIKDVANKLRQHWFYDYLGVIESLAAVEGSLEKGFELLSIKELNEIGLELRRIGKNPSLAGAWAESALRWCGICFEAFEDANSHKEHMRTHHKSSVSVNLTDPESRFFTLSCPVCSKTFNRRDYLRNHLKRHTTLTASLECDFCSRKFKFHSSLRRHQIKHTNTTYNCSYCHRNFHRRDSFRRHIKKSCSRHPNTCPICRKTFSKDSTESLGEHLLNSHPGVRYNYTCSVCRKRFITRYEFNKHTLRYTMRALWCKICGQGFHHNTSLQEHIVGVHLRALPCKSVSQIKAVDEYERRVKCSDCGKSFTRSSGLCRHKRIHNDVRNYPCRECNLRFRESGALRRHMRTHWQLRPFECPVCNKSFASATSRREHILRFHQKEIPPETVIYDMKHGRNIVNQTGREFVLFPASRPPPLPPPLPPPRFSPPSPGLYSYDDARGARNAYEPEPEDAAMHVVQSDSYTSSRSRY